MIDPEKITISIIKIVKEAGDLIRRESKRFIAPDIEKKGLHNYVTYVDKSSEAYLIDKLQRIVPGSVFLAEEGTVAKEEGEYLWIIDPLDGTTNYIHQIPVYSVSVALYQKSVPVSGVVYEINRDECFYSWQGGQAFLNGNQIKVSENDNMEESLIATGFPYYDYHLLDPYLEIIKYLIKNTRGMRRIGSAAVDLCYVACGRFDGFFEYSLHPWDVAAGSFILEQAGGKVTDFSGGNDYLYGKKIIASNAWIHKPLRKIISQFIK